MDCYNCKYRRNVPGDAHSQCVHPDAGNDGDTLFGIISLLTGNHSTKLNIEADEHGVKNGWFLFPFNFDPVWLKKCDGFTPIKIDNKEIKVEEA